MIIQNASHITPGIQRRQFRRAELLKCHHPPESTDRFVVKRVLENLPYFLPKRVFGNLCESGNILRHALHVNVNLVCIHFILRRCRFDDRVKNSLFAGKVIIK